MAVCNVGLLKLCEVECFGTKRRLAKHGESSWRMKDAAVAFVRDARGFPSTGVGMTIGMN